MSMTRYRRKETIEAYQMMDGVLGRETLRVWLGINHGLKPTPGQWVLRDNRGTTFILPDDSFRAQFEPCSS